MLTTRGHALIQLGRTGEAEIVLRKAVALSPGLKEPSSNLAFSLWLQDDPRKKDEAARIIAGVWRRTPRATAESVPPDKVPPAEVEKTPPQEIPIEIFEISTAGLDMSGGKRLTLPDLKIPGTLEASVAMHPVYGKLIRELQTRLEQLSERGEEYQQKVEARSGAMRVPTAPELNAMRARASHARQKGACVRPSFHCRKHRRGFIYLFVDRLDDARELVHQMIELDPNAPQGYWVGGSLLMANGKYEEAIEAFQFMDPLRDAPRNAKMLTRLNVPK